MRAGTIMLVAIGAGVLGRWAHNQKAVPSAAGVVQVLFAWVVLTLLDQGQTAPVAQGLAWLFLVSVLLSNNSPLTGLANATKGK